MEHHIRVSQFKELPASLICNGKFFYRIAYSRSAESSQNEESGQDYLTVREDGERLAFSVCDGVSQSYMGNIGAKILGDCLVNELWDFRSIRFFTEPNHLPKAKANIMVSLFSAARIAKQVLSISNQFITENDNEMLRRALLEKRDTVGTEGNFAAGIIDKKEQLLFLIWMGDLRIRIYSEEKKSITHLGDPFKSSERWSSKRVLVGELHCQWFSLEEVSSLVVYTDGLNVLDYKNFSAPLANELLNHLIEESRHKPTSDDISIFEWWNQRPTHFFSFEENIFPDDFLKTTNSAERVLIPNQSSFWISDNTYLQKLVEKTERDTALEEIISLASFPVVNVDKVEDGNQTPGYLEKESETPSKSRIDTFTAVIALIISINGLFFGLIDKPITGISTSLAAIVFILGLYLTSKTFEKRPVGRQLAYGGKSSQVRDVPPVFVYSPRKRIFMSIAFIFCFIFSIAIVVFLLLVQFKLVILPQFLVP